MINSQEQKRKKNIQNIKTLQSILSNLHNDTIIIDFKESYKSCTSVFKLITLYDVHHYELIKCQSLLECTKLLNEILINENCLNMFKCFNNFDYTFKNNKITINNFMLL